MAIIALEGMYFRALHGFYPEENIVGNDFIVDVYVEADIRMAAMSDELYEPVEEDSEEDEDPLSVNYETIYLLCESEMRKTSKLLETVAQGIATRIHSHFSNVLGLRVRVRKLHPPLRGPVHSAYVEIATGVMAGRR